MPLIPSRVQGAGRQEGWKCAGPRAALSGGSAAARGSAHGSLPVSGFGGGSCAASSERSRRAAAGAGSLHRKVTWGHRPEEWVRPAPRLGTREKACAERRDDGARRVRRAAPSPGGRRGRRDGGGRLPLPGAWSSPGSYHAAHPSGLGRARRGPVCNVHTHRLFHLQCRLLGVFLFFIFQFTC